LRVPYLLAWGALGAAGLFAGLGWWGGLGWGVAAVGVMLGLGFWAVLFSIGVLGEYVGRMHRMVRGRPPYWVAATTNLPAEREVRLAGRARGE